MRNYHQPDFYHFSEDSVLLAKYAAKKLSHRKDLDVLDLCSGCGVVGIEFVSFMQKVNRIDFVELQKEFKDFMLKNIDDFIAGTQTNILTTGVLEVNFPQQYDLVLANPPYYLDGHGRISDHPKKNTCHFMDKQNFEAFMTLAKNSLKADGIFYFTGRKEQELLKQYLHQGLIKEELSLNKSSIFTLVHD